MSAWLIGLVGLIYLFCSVEFFVKGNNGMGMAFLGYAIGNLGLLMVTR